MHKYDVVVAYIRLKPSCFGSSLVIHNILANRTIFRRWTVRASALSALMAVYWTAMALTGNGELGFDSGEGA